MPHPLVFARFPSPDAAVKAAGVLHGIGIGREAISVVARTHAQQGVLARAMDATPGADIEDSRAAGRLGEMGAVVIAAAATVMPGAGALVAAGPLSAELGEAAGHLAGSLRAVLERAGVDPRHAASWHGAVERGEVLLGIHVDRSRVAAVEEALASTNATEVAVAEWGGEVPG